MYSNGNMYFTPSPTEALGEADKSGDTECHKVYACSRYCYGGMQCEDVWVMYT